MFAAKIAAVNYIRKQIGELWCYQNNMQRSHIVTVGWDFDVWHVLHMRIHSRAGSWAGKRALGCADGAPEGAGQAGARAGGHRMRERAHGRAGDIATMS